MKIKIELTGVLESAVTAIATREGVDPAEYFTARCFDLAAKYARQEACDVADNARAQVLTAKEAEIDAALPVKAEAVKPEVVEK